MFKHTVSVLTVAVTTLTSRASNTRLWWYHNPKDLYDKAHNSWQCDNL